MEDQVREFLVDILPEHADLLANSELSVALKSGVVLCDLACHCVPNAIATVNTQQQDNIDNFIRALKPKLSVSEPSIFVQADLFEGKNMEKVFTCIIEMQSKLENGDYPLAGTGPKRGTTSAITSPRNDNQSNPTSFVGKTANSGGANFTSPRTGNASSTPTGNIKKEALARQMRIWLANVLPQFSDDLTGEKSFYEVLKSGVILCELVNYLKPGSIKVIHQVELPFKQRENIGNFLAAISKELKILEVTQFTTPCLFEGKNLGKVVDCIVEIQKNYDVDSYRTSLTGAVNSPGDVESLAPPSDNAKSTSAVEKPRAGNTLVSKNSFLEALKVEVRNWIARVLPQFEEDLLDQSKTFGSVLKSGVILCELAIALIPDCIDSKIIHTGGLVFKQRDNISAFIEVCEVTLQFDQNLMFVTADLFEEKNLGKVAATIAEVQKKFFPEEWKESNQIATQKGMEQADAEVVQVNDYDAEEEERERKAEQFRKEREEALARARAEKAEIEAAERARRMENSERQKREREDRIRQQKEDEERALEEERELERKRLERIEREKRERIEEQARREAEARQPKQEPKKILPTPKRGGPDPPSPRDDEPMKVGTGGRGGPMRGGRSPVAPSNNNNNNNYDDDDNKPTNGAKEDIVDDLRAQLARLDEEERLEREERDRKNREMEEEYQEMLAQRASRVSKRVVEREPEPEPEPVQQPLHSPTRRITNSPKPLPQIKNSTNKESQKILEDIKNHDQNKLSLFPITFLGNTNITSMIMTTSESAAEIIEKACAAKNWDVNDYEPFDQEGVPIEDVGLTPSQMGISGILLRNKKGLEHTATFTIEITEESLRQFEKDNAKKSKSKGKILGFGGKKGGKK